ncbi:FixH family protein [Planococcus lenghuensis]|nr:FixH family protein [Planococcus lenghuensis]
MKKLVPLLFTAAVLTACDSGESTGAGEAEPSLPEPLEVSLQVQETVVANEPVELTAIVTQGTEAVTGADEVEFEVWQEEEKESSNLLTAGHEGEGVYVAETLFAEAGVYHIQSHVTARDMHTMPETTITVSGPEPALGEETAHPYSHDAHGTVTIHLAEPGAIQLNEPAIFNVHAKSGEVQLTGADVSLELWREGAEKHEWVKLTEQEGAYTGEVTFAEAGTYQVQTHVMKDSDSIHEHTETVIEVLE